MKYKYEYQPRKKYICPNCGHKTLKRFIDTTTGELINESYGVCERISSCGYVHRPETEKVETVTVDSPPLIPFYFDSAIMEETLNNFKNNILFKFLADRFGYEEASFVFYVYKIGTTNSGDTIFWQVDQFGRIHYGKGMQYFTDGHRNKARNAWCFHRKGGKDINGFNSLRHEINYCFFGQHLLQNEHKHIFVVESEKTALICQLNKTDPDALFLACGGMQNLGLIKNLHLNKDQEIICLPDTDSNKIWQTKIDKLQLNATIKIIPSLQKMKLGSDIGDLLLKHKQNVDT